MSFIVTCINSDGSRGIQVGRADTLNMAATISAEYQRRDSDFTHIIELCTLLGRELVAVRPGVEQSPAAQWESVLAGLQLGRQARADALGIEIAQLADVVKTQRGVAARLAATHSYAGAGAGYASMADMNERKLAVLREERARLLRTVGVEAVVLP